MADNYAAKDATNTTVTFDSDDIGAGVQRPRVEVAAAPAGAMVDIGNSTSTAGIITDSVGTVIGFLRGIVILLLRFPASIGQKAKTASLAVTLASDEDPLQLTAGSESIGGVKDNGPHYTPLPKLGSSGDATISPMDVTDAPGDSADLEVLDDLLISVAADMVITLKEDAGANLAVFHMKAAAGAFHFAPKNRVRGGVNKKLVITSSAAGQIYTWASWHEETP